MTDGPGALDELRDGIRRVLTERASRARVQAFIDSGDLYDKGLWDEAANLGWFALTVPEELDGIGLGFDAAALLYEELGRSVAPMPLLGTLLVIQALTDHGTDAQKAVWLPELAIGAAPASLATIDPKGKILSAQLRNGAEGALVLSGEVHNLIDGAAAGLLLVTARKEDGALYLVLVRAEEAGVTVDVDRLVDRTRHLASARFDDVVLPADRVLGEKPVSADISAALLGHAALALACDAIGGADAILDFTLEYLKTRVQFGKPIGSFQALKHRCANHKVALEAARVVTEEAVLSWAEGRSDALLQAFLAKSYVCEVAAIIATDAVQLHGGIGVTWEHPCHIFLKRAKLNEVLFGGRAAYEDRAAALLLNPVAAA